MSHEVDVNDIRMATLAGLKAERKALIELYAIQRVLLAHEICTVEELQTGKSLVQAQHPRIVELNKLIDNIESAYSARERKMAEEDHFQELLVKLLSDPNSLTPEDQNLLAFKLDEIDPKD